MQTLVRCDETELYRSGSTVSESLWFTCGKLPYCYVFKEKFLWKNFLGVVVFENIFFFFRQLFKRSKKVPLFPYKIVVKEGILPNKYFWFC